MIVGQWHLVIPYGKQAEALAAIRAWGAEKSALAGMSAPQFRRHSDVLAPFVVPGSQHWIVDRVLDAGTG